MRQFISLRFWLTLVALAGLAVGTWYFVPRDDAEAAVDPGTDPDAEAAVVGQQIDQVLLVYGIQAEPGFDMVEGRTTTEMRLFIDSTRVVFVKPGTPGVINCEELDEIGACVVALQLLGDGVIWFELIPSQPGRDSIALPAIREVRDDNWVLLANGWEVQRAPTVERSCPNDNEGTSSLADFIRRYGDNSRATFQFEAQQVVRVLCVGV